MSWIDDLFGAGSSDVDMTGFQSPDPFAQNNTSFVDPWMNQNPANPLNGLYGGTPYQDPLQGTSASINGAPQINPMTGLPVNQYVNLANSGSGQTVPFVPGSGSAGASATGWNGNIYINNAPPPSQNKSGLPDWLNELLPNATAGSLLGGLFQAGLGVAGSNAQADALRDLTAQQAGNFAQGTQAYYDAVNRQTGAYGDATGAYKERNAAQQKAYEDQVGQYNSLLDLQKGAYGDQKSAYDANFAAQQKAYQDQTSGLRQRS